MSDSGLSISSKGEILRPSKPGTEQLSAERGGDEGDQREGRTQEACALCDELPGPGIGCEECEAFE